MFDYIKQHYNVPAEMGRKVIVDGRSGVIAADRGHYIGVNFDDSKAGHISNCHPTWRVEYGEMGTIRKPSKGALRYKRFLQYGESFDSFILFCRWDADPERSWNSGNFSTQF